MKNNKNLSVLFFSHCGIFSGAERSLVDLIDGLNKEGVLCSVIVPQNGRLVARLEAMGVATHVIPGGYSWWAFSKYTADRKKDFLIKNSLNVLKNEILPLAKKIRPDFIYSQTIVIPWGAICAAKLKIPHVLSAREYGELDHDLVFYCGFKKSMRTLYENSEIIFSVTDDVKNKVFKEFSRNPGFNDKCVSVGSSIHIPDEIMRLAADFPPKKLDKKQRTSILILGSICSGKGQIDAVRAVAKLKKAGYEIRLTLMGWANDKYCQGLKNEIIGRKIQDMVAIKEYSENGLEEIVKNDIVLSCSKMEALGRVILEAALLGRPFIYANSGGSQATFVNSVHGLAYHPGDAAELARKIAETIEFSGKTRLRIINAKKYVANVFNDKNYMKKQKDILLEYKESGNYIEVKNSVEKLIVDQANY
jgi:glycosyltransferase involved in cell wall biosynthesis